jgi:hypothetical protein
MNDTSKLENARAGREALDAVASRAEGSSTAAVAAAMRRYLGAEQHHVLKEHDGRSSSEQVPTHQAG